MFLIKKNIKTWIHRGFTPATEMLDDTDPGNFPQQVFVTGPAEGLQRMPVQVGAPLGMVVDQTVDMEVSQNRGTPSYHEFETGIFP